MTLFLQMFRGEGAEKGMLVSEKEEEGKSKKNKGILKGLSTLKWCKGYRRQGLGTMNARTGEVSNKH